MPVIKQYLKYEHTDSFGIVCSPKTNAIFLNYLNTTNTYITTGCCEQIVTFNIRTREKTFSFSDNDSSVVLLKQSPNLRYLASGFEDGTIKVYDLLKLALLMTLSGHKSSVSSMVFEADSLRMISSSQDCTIIVWDLVEEKGLYKMKGHKNPIVSLIMVSHDVVATCSSDGVLKFWQLNSQHCFKTDYVGHQCSGLFFHVGFGYLFVISKSFSGIKCFKITFTESTSIEGIVYFTEHDDDTGVHGGLQVTEIGTIEREFESGTSEIVMEGALMGCHNAGKKIHFYLLATSEKELSKVMKKRNKKLRAKRQKREDGEITEKSGPSDIVRKTTVLQLVGKARSCQILSSGDLFTACVSLTCNTIEIYRVSVVEGTLTCSKTGSLSSLSHRSIVRATSISADNQTLYTASSDSIKLWNRTTCACTRTIQAKLTTCLLVAPGNKYVLAGNRNGSICIFDTCGDQPVHVVEAHSAAVWGMDVSPDLKSIVSGSADKTAKFWKFSLINDEDNDKLKRLSLDHVTTHEMEDEVLAVRLSRDNKYVVLSLLNNTVKICFVDTFRLLHNLYGHSLPALSVDVSDDSRFVITGGADRQIRIWGVDFGDCVKRILAHSDSITCLRFVPRSHYFFSASKDNKLRQWNADNYERILSLHRHFGPIWAMALSSCGGYVVTASSDNSIRLWTRTEEIHVPVEDQQEDLEKLHVDYEDDDRVVPGDIPGEVEMAGKVTCDTLNDAETLNDAVERFRAEVERRNECDDYELCDWMAVYGVDSPETYLIEIMAAIRPGELDRCLLLLPYSYALDVVSVLIETIQGACLRVEFVCRCLFFLLRIHHLRMTVDPSVQDLLHRIGKSVFSALDERQAVFGFVSAGIKFMSDQLQNTEIVEGTTHRNLGKRRKINKFVTFLNSFQ